MIGDVVVSSVEIDGIISEERMGKKKKGYNWRAREQPGAELDTSALAAMQGILQLPPSRTTAADQGTNILGGSPHI